MSEPVDTNWERYERMWFILGAVSLLFIGACFVSVDYFLFCILDALISR